MTLCKVPVVRFQQAAADCGVASIAMILDYFGLSIPIRQLRELVDWGRDGTSVVAIKELLDSTAMHYRIDSVDLDYFSRHVRIPCMVHWRFSHWVVFEGVDKKGYHLVDPQQGRMVVSVEEFSRSFTGVVVYILEDPPDSSRWLMRIGLAWKNILSAVNLFWRMISWGRVSVAVVSAFVLQLVPGVGAWLTGTLFGRLSEGLEFSAVTVCLLCILMYGTGAGLATFCRNIASAQLGATVRIAVSERMLSVFLRASYRYIESRSAGDVVNRIVGVQALQNLISNALLTILFDIFALIVYSVLVLIVWIEMGVFVCIILVIYASFLLFAGRKLYRLSMAAAHASSSSQSDLFESCSNIEAIKLAQAEERVSSRWLHSLRWEVGKDYSFLRYQAFVQFVGTLLQQVLPLCVLAYGLFLFGRGSVSIGVITGVNSLLGTLLGSTMAISYSAQQILSSGVAVERVRDMLSAPTETGGASSRSGGGTATFNYSLMLNSVAKRYGGSATPVLRDVSLVLRPGQFVGIKGRTGSGKTTLLRTVLCLEDINGGNISFDGVDQSLLSLGSVRRLFGVVSQDPQIIAGTLRDNLTLGRQDWIADELLFETLETVLLRDEVVSMPMGLDTIVGGSGVGLSGGQCQRLAIARAVLRDCSILVLDEATSALDGSTERLVIDRLRRKGIAVLCATHRESTLLHADAVYELVGGRLFNVTGR